METSRALDMSVSLLMEILTGLERRVAELEVIVSSMNKSDDPNQLVLDVGGQLFPTSRDDIARSNCG